MTTRIAAPLVAAALLTLACGSGPTEPAVPSAAGSIGSAAPEPQPTPAPNPAPTPAPNPTPAPPPAPPPLERWAVTLDDARWIGAPLVGRTFEIWIYRDSVEVETGSRPWDRLPIVFAWGGQIMASRDEGRAERLVVRHVDATAFVDYSGPAGWAMGRAVRR